MVVDFCAYSGCGGQFPQASGDPAFGRIVHGGDLSGLNGDLGIAHDADAGRVEEVGAGVQKGGRTAVIEQLGAFFAGDDGGGFNAQALGQQQGVAGPQARGAHQAVVRGFPRASGR